MGLFLEAENFFPGLSKYENIVAIPVLDPCHLWPAVGASVWPAPTFLSPWQTDAGFRTCRLCNVPHKSSPTIVAYHVTDLNVQNRKFLPVYSHSYSLWDLTEPLPYALRQGYGSGTEIANANECLSITQRTGKLVMKQTKFSLLEGKVYLVPCPLERISAREAAMFSVSSASFRKWSPSLGRDLSAIFLASSKIWPKAADLFSKSI